MQSAALLEARRRGANPFPVLRVTWAARGLSLGTGIYAPAGRATAAGQVSAVTGTWEPIEYGSGIERGIIEAVEAAVAISDAKGELLRMLETYDPRGSVAAADWAAPGLVVADWEPMFRGIVADWQRDGLYTALLLKTDDTVLRRPVPSSLFQRAEWPSASDSTIYGTAMPLVMGIHDSYAITARGMIPAVNVRYDKDLGRWWLASIGHLVEIRRIYYDGVAQADTIWTTRRGVWGGNVCTLIEITEGSQPEKGVVVSFDCEGPDSTGGYSSTSITNPVRQLRTVLEEYVYREPPLAAYRGDDTIIDDTSWDAAETWFESRGYESARRWGADQNPETAVEVIQSFLDAHPFVRIHWTPSGTLAIVILDADDVDPEALDHVPLDLYHQGGRVEYQPGDRREVYTHLVMPYMWSTAEQKFVGSLAAHDVAALPEKVSLEVPNVWTQGRYTQS